MFEVIDMTKGVSIGHGDSVEVDTLKRLSSYQLLQTLPIIVYTS
jgi:hypothetical protein